MTWSFNTVFHNDQVYCLRKDQEGKQYNLTELVTLNQCVARDKILESELELPNRVQLGVTKRKLRTQCQGISVRCKGGGMCGLVNHTKSP